MPVGKKALRQAQTALVNALRMRSLSAIRSERTALSIIQRPEIFSLAYFLYDTLS